MFIKLCSPRIHVQVFAIQSICFSKLTGAAKYLNRNAMMHDVCSTVYKKRERDSNVHTNFLCTRVSQTDPNINTMLCPITVNSNTIELDMHTSCYCGLRLTLCYIDDLLGRTVTNVSKI